MRKTSEMMVGTHKRNAPDEQHESDYECPGCGRQFPGPWSMEHHTSRCQKALRLEGDDAGELNDPEGE